MQRLDPTVLPALDAAIERPRYVRHTLRAGIVHLGVGAFQRAHLGPITDAALHAHPDDMRWGVMGVSLRRPDTRDALAPQDGLYTLALRDADAGGSPRQTLQVIGNLLGVLVAAENPGAVLERIAHAETRIVSLTVTEKGYCHDPSTGALRVDHPDVQHDLGRADVPRGTLGFLVHGLQRRRARGLRGVTLLSLDNLPSNGDTLRVLVDAFAERVDPSLRDWIERHCSFPNSMVDRIVPRTTDADRERIASALGAHDAWPVVAEPFLDWAVEDRFAEGRPDWQAGGARFVAEAAPFERLKLRMVNGAHSAIAYLGATAGFDTVDRAMANPALRRYIEALMRDEVQATLEGLGGVDLAAYRARLLQRFDNPALHHRTRQIAMDGSQKLPQRLVGTVRDRLAAGLPVTRLALAIAAWLHYLRGVDERGQSYDIDDPLAPELAERRRAGEAAASGFNDPAQAHRVRIEALLRYEPVFGDLAQSRAFVEAVARQARSLVERGVLATLEASP